ncbi:MAG TPA: DMT family transporter [Candidatus Methanofastidiosa archaeon]|nr:DMT family transporter [Candidatus Methanofastidiosa archaeon]HPR41750.1 DMT family transporter [Candidatus Methanofastidiosa archaeon]
MLQGRKGELATFAATLFWGSSFVVIKSGLNQIDPMPFVVLRFIAASILFTVIFLICRKGLGTGLLRNKYVYLMSLFNAGGFLFQYIGLDHTSAIKGSLLVNINVIFVMLIAHFYLNETVTPRKALSVLGGVLGIFLLITEGDLGVLGSGSGKGDMAVLVGGVCWAFYIVLSRKVVRDGADIFGLNYMLTILTTAVLLPLLWGTEFDLNAGSMAYILYIAFFCTIVTFMLWTYGLKTVSATASSVMLMNEVVFASFLGMLLLGERLDAYGYAGAMIMVIAIANMALERKRKYPLSKG